MRGPGKGVMSATTQVKVSSPEITIFALGQRFNFLEASTGASGTGEFATGVPGSKSVAGERTVYIGTWENRTAAFQKEASMKPKRQRGGMTLR